MSFSIAASLLSSVLRMTMHVHRKEDVCLMLFAQGIVDAQADKMVMKTYKVLSFTSSLWLCHVQSLCTRFYSLIVSVWSSHCQASNHVPCSKEEDVRV